MDDDQISGLPNWAKSENYDISAKVGPSDVAVLQKLTIDQRRRMLQPLLVERFKLKVHFETKELPVYALVIDKKGPRIREARTGGDHPPGIQGGGGDANTGMMFMGAGQITGQGVPIASLVKMLSQQNLGRRILDKTGLTGKYDFKLQWSPEKDSATMFTSAQNSQQRATPSVDSSLPGIFTALQEQLGLKLESQKGPVQTLVIDHAEKPSDN
jgi:uncharacterized protein (TIGR03435 family)